MKVYLKAKIKNYAWSLHGLHGHVPLPVSGDGSVLTLDLDHAADHAHGHAVQ